jgi:hypothetical protein
MANEAKELEIVGALTKFRNIHLARPLVRVFTEATEETGRDISIHHLSLGQTSIEVWGEAKSYQGMHLELHDVIAKNKKIQSLGLAFFLGEEKHLKRLKDPIKEALFFISIQGHYPFTEADLKNLRLHNTDYGYDIHTNITNFDKLHEEGKFRSWFSQTLSPINNPYPN